MMRTNVLTIILSLLMFEATFGQKSPPDDWLSPRAQITTAATRPLLKGSTNINDRTFTLLDMDASSIMPQMLWEEDGSFLYLLDAGGVLRKISIPGFKEEKTLDLSAQCTQLARSKCGLIALLPNVQQLVVIDSANMQVARRIKATGATHAACAPASPLALVCIGTGEQLAIINLQDGRIVGALNATSSMRFLTPALTPDAGTFFSSDGRGRWSRFAMINNVPIFKEYRSDMGDQDTCTLDANSRFVAFPNSGGSIRSIPEHPRIGQWGLYIYSVADVRRPLFNVPNARMPAVFDNSHRCLYARRDRALAQYDSNGQQTAEYNMEDPPVDISVHPRGVGLLLRTTFLYWSPSTKEKAYSEESIKISTRTLPLNSESHADKVTVIKLPLPANNLVGEMLWSSDGTSIFVLERTGILHRLNLASSGKDIADIHGQLGASCSWLSRSKAGLLVRVDGKQEAWLIGEEAMNIKHRTPMPGSGRLLASPGAPAVVMITPDRELIACNIETGTFGNRLRLHPFSSWPTLSPDGRFAFVTVHNKSFSRYELDALTLTPAGDSPSFGPRNLAIDSAVSISPDSRFLALVTPDGLEPPPQFPRIDNKHGVYVFRTDKNDLPLLGIPARRPISSIAFDSHGRIYTFRDDGFLACYDIEKGTSLFECKTLPNKTRIQDAVVHPDQNWLLARSTDSLFWIKLAEKAPDSSVPSASDIRPISSSGNASPQPGASPEQLAPVSLDDRVPRHLMESKKTAGNTQIGTLNVDAPNILPCLQWTGTNQFLAVTAQGHLRRIALPEGLLLASQRLEHPCKEMALAKNALLISTTDLPLILILDPQALKITHKIPLSGVNGMAASPSSDMAFIFMGNPPNQITSLNVKTGAVGATTTADEMWKKYSTRAKMPTGVRNTGQILNNFEQPVMSSDGRYVLSRSFSRMHRFLVKGSDLIYDECGIETRAKGVALSSDSRYMATIMEGTVPALPDIGSYGVCLFALDNLQKPLKAIRAKAYSRPVAIDSARKCVYVGESNSSLGIYDMSGKPLGSHSLSCGQIKQILVDPSGQCLVILGESALMCVDRRAGN